MNFKIVASIGISLVMGAVGVAVAVDVERLPAPVGPIPEEIVTPVVTGTAEIVEEILHPPKANFDGNTYGDLAVGAHREEVNGGDMAGSVAVFYWSTGSVNPSSGDYWEQIDVGGHSSPEPDDTFGAALAAGDFNGDGVYDLAIGSHAEDWQSTADAGIVLVMYGVSGTGLSGAGADLWHQDISGVNGVLEEGDFFGFSLAAGDFNGDGYDDLAIGVPYEDSAATNDGAVNILYGTAGGLNATSPADQLFDQTSFGLTAGSDEYFGRSLATGDFNDDGYDDLAIGAPGDDVFTADRAGSVFVAHGSANRLVVPASGYWWHQNVNGVDGTAEDFDGFGQALAAGDFDDDGYDDLAIGVPYEDLGNPVVPDAGAVHVLYGSSSGTTASGETFLYQGNGDTSNGIEADDSFGSSLAVGDFNNDSYDDLVVGVPSENWSSIVDAGMVHVFFGTGAGVDDADQYIVQSLLSTDGVNESYDSFGYALASTDFDGDGFDDLAIGVPGKDRHGETNTGRVTVVYGTTTAISLSNNNYGQITYGVGVPETDDYFGMSLAAVPFQTTSPDAIFADGFESGGTSAWSSVSP